MKRVFETAECEVVRNSIFWQLRYEKHENQMKGCVVELTVSDSGTQNFAVTFVVCPVPSTLCMFAITLYTYTTKIQHMKSCPDHSNDKYYMK